jgi:hypothetical protein
VLAETRIISQHLDEAYATLLPYFAPLGSASAL